jgi:hypothetical protein
MRQAKTKQKSPTVGVTQKYPTWPIRSPPSHFPSGATCNKTLTGGNWRLWFDDIIQNMLRSPREKVWMGLFGALLRWSWHRWKWWKQVGFESRKGMRELSSLSTGNFQFRRATKRSPLIDDGKTNSWSDSGTIRKLGLERLSVRQCSQLL